jgi:hypothetical protein
LPHATSLISLPIPFLKLGFRRFLLGLLALVLTYGSPVFSAEPLHAGPLYDHFDLTFVPADSNLQLWSRTEALGPFFYSEQQDTRHTWAIPPLFSHTQDSATESEEYDIVYPILTYDRFGQQYRWQIFQLFSFAGGPSETEKVRRRFTLFPIYFQQRSSDSNENYTAVGPFYGHLKNRLFRDEISYMMFPIYSETRKKDVITDNYMYPLFHLRHGDGLTGWQFWPFVGHEHKEVTTQTNGFGDVSTVPGHDRRFVMWPLYYNQHNNLGTANAQWNQGSIPLYDFMRSPLRDSTTVLWPFFSTIDDREKKYHEWQMPWPFVVIARGEGKRTTRFFPFYSQARSPGTNVPPGASVAMQQSDFYLWPAYVYKRFHSDPLDRSRKRIFFFLYSDTIQKNTVTGAYKRRRDFWPFYTHKRDYNGDTSLQILSILEPYLPQSKSIERDYSQLWSIWRAENDPNAGRTSQSLLWNLYRHETTRESKRTSFFFGLYQTRSEPAGKSVRLFYIPIVNSGRPTHSAQVH